MDTKSKVLDIAMNLNRIGNWAADDYIGKKQRIKTFLDNTSEYIKEIGEVSKNSSFRKTYESFLKEYSKLLKEEKEGPKYPLLWAEDMITWGNILTHRASLI